METAKKSTYDVPRHLEEDEDDAPLSEVIRGLTPKKPKGKGGGAVVNVSVGSPGAKDTASPGKSPTPGPTDRTTGPKGTESTGGLKRIRTTLLSKGENTEKGSTVVGKQKVPQDAKLVRGPNKLLGKAGSLEEEEMKVVRKKAKTDSNGRERSRLPAPAAAAAPASPEPVIFDGAVRVAAFRRARDAVNKQLAQQSTNSLPVSEAACTEVEFSQDMETAAVQDYKKLCEDLAPAAQEYLDNGKQIDAESMHKCVEARFKMLRSKIDLHFAIAQHLVGPLFTLNQNTTSTLDEEVRIVEDEEGAKEITKL